MSVEICSMLCTAQKSCASYGYSAVKGSCYLKKFKKPSEDDEDTEGKEEEPEKCCDPGFCPMAPPMRVPQPVRPTDTTKGCTLKRGFDILGEVTRQVKSVPNLNVCAALCLADPDCGTFAFGKKKGTPAHKQCFLKRGHEMSLGPSNIYDSGRCGLRQKPELNCSQLPKQKLVVNSHVKYGKPLEMLYMSLRQMQFQADCPRFSSIVTVLGGAQANTPPHRPPGVWGDFGITVINTTLNSHDLHALSAIYHYIDHPLVRANSYFYVLDTVSIGDQFARKFDHFAAAVQANDIHLPSRPNSNIFVFGHGVARRYRETYDQNISKETGLYMEHIWNWTSPPHITHFASRVVELGKRLQMLDEDPYQTGFKRAKFWYPDFDLFKYVMMGYSGDISEGQLKPNVEISPELLAANR